MRTYVEALEVVSEEGVEPDFIRLEIGEDMTEEEAIQLIKDLMTPPYNIYRHLCFHDEEPKKPCSLELIEEVR